MRKIKLYVETGYCGASYSEVIEVDDNTTSDELDSMAFDYMQNYIGYGWEEEE